MTYDEKQTKAYNAKYDGFEVRCADGNYKLFEKYGWALRYVRTHIMACQIIGLKLDFDTIGIEETVLFDWR